MADPEVPAQLPDLSGDLTDEEFRRRIEERRRVTPHIDLADWEAAQRDPAVHQALAEARAEGEKYEKTEWGYALKPEYREDAEDSSLLRRGAAVMGNLGKIAFSGNMREALAQALRRPF
jgi:hypothetical protein